MKASGPFFWPHICLAPILEIGAGNDSPIAACVQKLRCSKMTKHALPSDAGETAIPRAPEQGDASALGRPLRACWGHAVFPLAALACLVLLESTAGSDEFVLKNGGRVEGELTNRDQSPRTTYVVRDKNGHTITLDADQVRGVKVQSESERN